VCISLLLCSCLQYMTPICYDLNIRSPMLTHLTVCVITLPWRIVPCCPNSFLVNPARKLATSSISVFNQHWCHCIYTPEHPSHKVLSRFVHGFLHCNISFTIHMSTLFIIGRMGMLVDCPSRIFNPDWRSHRWCWSRIWYSTVSIQHCNSCCR
jgi:hypothetical protein